MNFFMYSKCGEGAGLLKRIQDEGNECELFIKYREYESVYDGILKKARKPKEGSIVIFDSSGMGREADALRQSGYKVFGASKFHDKLENHRGFGLEYMQSHGISVPKTEVFTEFSKGIEFLKGKRKGRYVFKPSGKECPSHLTYVGEDSEDLISFMEFAEEYFSEDIDDFVLQEYVEGPIISTEFWVGAEGFLEPMNHTVEVKKLMDGDIGPSTGCSGNLVWACDTDVIGELLYEIEGDLIKEGFLGPIDINCIVTESDIYGLEWTPRFGLDAMPSLIALVKNDLGQMISDLVNGTDTKMKLYEDFSGGIRVTIPPYPCEASNYKVLSKIAPNEGIPIRNLEGDDVYYYEVKEKDGELVHAFGSGVIACVSNIGGDPEECFPLKGIEEARIPQKQYRTDLGKVLPEMYEEVMETLNVVSA